MESARCPSSAARRSQTFHELQRAIVAIASSADSLSRLIEDLLDLSRLTSGKFTLTPVPTEVAPVLESAVEIVKPIAMARKLTFAVELDQNLGTGQTVPTAAWQKGVWRRDFDNGIVLVNPKGNGPQTVTLETSYIKIKGAQDPVTNNGQTVTTVTLKDRDGIILLRPTPVTRPATPTGFSVEH